MVMTGVRLRAETNLIILFDANAFAAGGAKARAARFEFFAFGFGENSMVLGLERASRLQCNESRSVEFFAMRSLSMTELMLRLAATRRSYHTIHFGFINLRGKRAEYDMEAELEKRLTDWMRVLNW